MAGSSFRRRLLRRSGDRPGLQAFYSQDQGAELGVTIWPANLFMLVDTSAGFALIISPGQVRNERGLLPEHDFVSLSLGPPR
jgi:hypothetical protein